MIEQFSKIGFLRKEPLFKLNFKEPLILDFDANNKEVFIIGDLHQDDYSLINILKATEFFERDDIYLIFLGDYIDRGADKFLINKLLVLKHYFKKRVILLGGNHEIPPNSSLIPPLTYEDDFFNYLGFLKKEGYVDDEVINFYNNLFENLPILVSLKFKDFNFLLVHGGIPRFNFQRGYPKIIEDFFFLDSPIGMSYINDFLWNDFGEFKNFSSEIRYQVSKKELEYFLFRYKYDYVIRAHEAVSKGYKIDYNRVITIFSNGDNNRSSYSVKPKIFHLNSGTIFNFDKGILKPEKTIFYTKFDKNFYLIRKKLKKRFSKRKYKKASFIRVTELFTNKSIVIEKDKLSYKYLKDLYGINLNFRCNLNKFKNKKILKISPVLKKHFICEVLEGKKIGSINVKYSFLDIKESNGI